MWGGALQVSHKIKGYSTSEATSRYNNPVASSPFYLEQQTKK